MLSLDRRLRTNPSAYFYCARAEADIRCQQPNSARALAEGQKLRMFELPGIRGGKYYERIEDIAAVYIDQLNQEYPRGPILLESFCAGALIAIEMANQLAETGGRSSILSCAIRRSAETARLGSELHKIDLQDGAESVAATFAASALASSLLRTAMEKARSHEISPIRTCRPRREPSFMQPISTTGFVPIAGRSRFSHPALASLRCATGAQVASLLPHRTVHLAVDRHAEIAD